MIAEYPIFYIESRAYVRLFYVLRKPWIHASK